MQHGEYQPPGRKLRESVWNTGKFGTFGKMSKCRPARNCNPWSKNTTRLPFFAVGFTEKTTHGLRTAVFLWREVRRPPYYDKPPVYLIVGSQKPTWHSAESFRLKESRKILANTRTWATSPEWVQTNIIYHRVPWFENIKISAFNAEKLPCNSTVQSPYLLKPYSLDVSFCKSVIFFLQNPFYTFLSFRTQPSTSRKKRLPKISCSLAPKSTPFWTTPGTLEIQRQSSRPDSMEGGYYGGSTMPNVWNGIL